MYSIGMLLYLVTAGSWASEGELSGGVFLQTAATKAVQTAGNNAGVLHASLAQQAGQRRVGGCACTTKMIRPGNISTKNQLHLIT